MSDARFILVNAWGDWFVVDTAGPAHKVQLGGQDYQGYIVGQYKTSGPAKRYANKLNRKEAELRTAGIDRRF
jgi:hypothetical protein